MIDVKRSAAVVPLFTVKAIYATKKELIAKPISIAGIARITCRPMPPRVWLT
jgi:hypothetical protein